MATEKGNMRARKHPQMDIPIERLFLDTDNPRLPADIQGKNEADLLKALYKGFNLDELAESMIQNGYFDEEPLVIIPRKPLKKTKAKGTFKELIKDGSTTFTVVEGNRRLAAAKLIVDSGLRDKLRVKHWTTPSEEVVNELNILPVIVYPKRSEVVPYLGVRHIVGIQKWDSYAKARYVARLVDEGQALQDVEAQIGDAKGSARKNYISYKLLGQARDEFDYDTTAAEESFSLLILAVGQGKIKRYLGLPTRIKDIDPDAPVPQENLESLKSLMNWLFGDGKYDPVIKESRDITNYLSHVVESKDAVKHLEKTRDLQEAYDLTDGEERMVIRYLASANQKLEGVLGIIHRNLTEDVIGEVKKCATTAQQLLKRVKEEQR